MTSSSSVKILPQGALIQDFFVEGHNIVLNFPNPELYKTHNALYFGETIGRVSNRIAKAEIQSLNGKSYRLAANDGPNCLHGGNVGWGKRDFEGPSAIPRRGRESQMYKYISRDAEEGFPGTVELRLWYTTSKPPVVMGAERIILDVEYEVELVGDEVAETVVAVTNHSYFNVGSGATLEGTIATLGTNLHLPVDDTQIPKGSIEPFPGLPSAGTPFTFTSSKPQVDHCLIMNPEPQNIPLDTRDSPMKQLVSLSHPSTGLHLEIESTEPAFQFYTGDGMDMPAVGGAPHRISRAGVAIEPSRYVDAVNRPEWMCMCLMKKGQVYGSRSRYSAWKAASI